MTTRHDVVGLMRCWARPLAALLIAAGALAGAGRNRSEAQDVLTLDFAYGSEKKAWIDEVTAQYNAANHKVGGKRIKVNPVDLGSGELIDEVISGGRKAHLVSPASRVYIELGNARWRKDSRSGGKDLVGKTENLVVSPVVIAMWRPMAEALGWPTKEIGWGDVLKLARDPKGGWASIGHAQFGSFKLGHTHPEYSNSGLISLLAEAYAGADKKDDLTVADVMKPETVEFVRGIERSVVHYGSSTGTFAKAMFTNGPTYLSAAVLYESSVVESYDRKKYPPTNGFDRDEWPVVAIYPKEGSFYSDHPIGVVERPEWVTDEHRAAAADYIAHLRAPEQQVKAIDSGFRPALELDDLKAKLATRLNKEHGVDPDLAQFRDLPVPDNDVMRAIREDLWPKCKKHARLVLVLDVSGSMGAPAEKLVNAKRGAQEAVKFLGDDDLISVMRFSSQPDWIAQDLPAKDGRQAAQDKIRVLIPGGETAMYDAVKLAHQLLQQNPRSDMIQAVVLLGDGANNISGGERVRTPVQNKALLDQLIEQIRVDSEQKTTRVYTIYYGADADKATMKRIADETKAESFEGNPATILKVFKKIMENF